MISCSATLSALVGRRTVVPEGLVAPPHGLAEALPRGEPLELVALAGVPGGAVEQGAYDLRGVEALLVKRLVDQQLHHLELVDREAGDARNQHLDPLVELLGRGGL